MKKNTKELKALIKKYNISVTIDKNMRDHSNDPFVMSKKEKAKKLLSKYPVPESFLHKPKPRPKTNTSSKPKA